MGGAKVSDKIARHREPPAEGRHRLLIGGAMSYTFLKADGHDTGKSLVENGQARRRPAETAEARTGRREARPAGPITSWPTAMNASANTKVVDGRDIPDGWEGFDIGPKTVAKLLRRHHQGRRHGHLERPGGQVRDRAVFAEGDQAGSPRRWPRAIGRHGRRRRRDGRGRRAVRLRRQGCQHVSTGGGAFLECLEGKKFNSLKVIPDLSLRSGRTTRKPSGFGTLAVRPCLSPSSQKRTWALNASAGEDPRLDRSVESSDGCGRGTRPPRPAATPSLLNCDFNRGSARGARRPGAAGAHAVHLDVMDGHFVPNISYGPLAHRRLAESARTGLRRPPDDLRPGPLPRRLHRRPAATSSSSTSRSCPIPTGPDPGDPPDAGCLAGLVLNPPTPL